MISFLFAGSDYGLHALKWSNIVLRCRPIATGNQQFQVLDRGIVLPRNAPLGSSVV